MAEHEWPDAPRLDPRPYFRYPKGLSEVKLEQSCPSHADFDRLGNALWESLATSLDICDQVLGQSSMSLAAESSDRDSVSDEGSVSSCTARSEVGSDAIDEPGNLYHDYHNSHDDVLPAGANDTTIVARDLLNIPSNMNDHSLRNLRDLYRERNDAISAIHNISERIISHRAAKLEKKMDWREPMMCIRFTASDRKQLSEGLAISILHTTQRLAYWQGYIDRDDLLPLKEICGNDVIASTQELILEEFVNICIRPGDQEFSTLAEALRLSYDIIGQFLSTKASKLEKSYIAMDILHAKSRTVFVERQKQIQEEMLRAKVRAVKYQD